MYVILDWCCLADCWGMVIVVSCGLRGVAGVA